MKLVKGDEQFSAFRELAKMVGCPDPEEAAYALEIFSSEYYQNDETLLMSLSLVKKFLSDFDVDSGQ